MIQYEPPIYVSVLLPSLLKALLTSREPPFLSIKETKASASANFALASLASATSASVNFRQSQISPLGKEARDLPLVHLFEALVGSALGCCARIEVAGFSASPAGGGMVDTERRMRKVEGALKNCPIILVMRTAFEMFDEELGNRVRV